MDDFLRIFFLVLNMILNKKLFFKKKKNLGFGKGGKGSVFRMKGKLIMVIVKGDKFFSN